MEIETIVRVILYVLASAALLWAAVGDFRKRKIPRVAGFGLLLIGLIFLLINQMWLEAVFYLTAIWGSRGGWWIVLYVLIAIGVVYRELDSLPLVVGILFVLSMFEYGWFGGGDSQVAFGLVAIASDVWMVLYLMTGAVVLVFVLNIFREGGILGAIKRFVFTLKNPPDESALRTPWTVSALMVGLVYLWVWPGIHIGGA